ncbi:hypothetical protein CTAYLR_007166 [Chrysophaeum taylorii]|uniref:Glycosyltransferase family 8 protein n=1 Tax=Chrysophaeum taylorii TaxID=2483200 RepID=A0AAD7UM79_9STRA|nr:hypothetical protein CTAYLR_007166 [Chrysophaeum taylorii]
MMRIAVLAGLVGTSRGAKRRGPSVEETMANWSEHSRCTRVIEPPSSYYSSSVLVAIAYDSEDPLPPLAVINSTLSQSAVVELAAVTTTSAKIDLLRLLRAPRVKSELPGDLGRRVRVCDGFDLVLAQRPALAALAAMDAPVRRRELLSVFNFAAFYLPHALSAARILYLDTDAIARGDIGRRAAAVFAGSKRPAAAVEDCSQRLGKYVNFGLLDRALRSDLPALRERFFGFQRKVTEDTCVFNRGVVLFDSERWRALRLTTTIEKLVAYYVKSKARLWRGGVSQPPFLVALAGRYKKLPLEWNVRGVGRVDLSKTELDRLDAIIQTKRPRTNSTYAALLRETRRVGPFEKRAPFVAPLAARANVIHFTGEIKPWKISNRAALNYGAYGVHITPSGHVLGECRLDDERALRHRNYSTTTQLFASGCFARLPLCSCGPHCVEACAAVWHRFVSPAARDLARSFPNYPPNHLPRSRSRSRSRSHPP